MKHIVVFAALLISATVMAQSRVERDQTSKAAFRKLHFFRNGRGMHVVPELIDVYQTMKKLAPSRAWMENKMKNEWGFNIVDHEVVGLFSVPYKEMNIGVLGCVACHSGKAAGIFILGLGNKNIDPVAVGKDARQIQNIYTKLKLKPKKGADYQEVKESALKFADKLSNDKIGNLTQGHVTVSFIRQWFFEKADQKMPEDLAPGAVKIPALWGYEEKRKIGLFSDGFGNGILPGWAIAVELTAGQDVETARAYMPEVEKAEALFSDFLPPKYPFVIDSQKAVKGLQVFSRTCQGCHGSYRYDSENLAVFEAPNWIPLGVVKTDDDRLKSNSPLFRDLVKTNSLNDYLQATDLGDGFFAPRLVGIWARFPYLHNASVPNIKALLTIPENRPEVFSLEEAGERKSFDEVSLGLVVSEEKEKLLKRAQKGDRRIFWTQRLGHSSRGHNFGTQLSEVEKTDLIEYLKTF